MNIIAARKILMASNITINPVTKIYKQTEHNANCNALAVRRSTEETGRIIRVEEEDRGKIKCCRGLHCTTTYTDVCSWLSVVDLFP